MSPPSPSGAFPDARGAWRRRRRHRRRRPLGPTGSASASGACLQCRSAGDGAGRPGCPCYPSARFAPLRASGGIGRRARFRSVCPEGRGGSTPPSRTQKRPLTRDNIPVRGLHALFMRQLVHNRPATGRLPVLLTGERRPTVDTGRGVSSVSYAAVVPNRVRRPLRRESVVIRPRRCLGCGSCGRCAGGSRWAALVGSGAVRACGHRVRSSVGCRIDAVAGATAPAWSTQTATTYGSLPSFRNPTAPPPGTAQRIALAPC